MFETNASSPKPTHVDIPVYDSSPELGKLFEALSKAQGVMKPAKLDMVNPHYKSKYASLTSVQEAFQGPFMDNGLTVTQQVFSIQNSYYIRTVLGHSSGQWISSTFRLIVGKNDMQGLGSAITYARRYAISALVGVVDTEDDDGNASLPDKSKSPPPAANNSPQPEKPKNFAPGADDDLDRQLREEAKHADLLSYLNDLVRMKNIDVKDMPGIIERAIGKRKKSIEMSIVELESVISYLKMK